MKYPLFFSYILLIATCSCALHYHRVDEMTIGPVQWHVQKKIQVLHGKFQVRIYSLEKNNQCLFDKDTVRFNISIKNITDTTLFWPIMQTWGTRRPLYNCDLMSMSFGDYSSHGFSQVMEAEQPIYDSLTFRSPFVDSIKIAPHDSLVLYAPFLPGAINDYTLPRFQEGRYKGFVGYFDGRDSTSDYISLVGYHPIHTFYKWMENGHNSPTYFDSTKNEWSGYTEWPLFVWLNDNGDHFGLYYYWHIFMPRDSLFSPGDSIMTDHVFWNSHHIADLSENIIPLAGKYFFFYAAKTSYSAVIGCDDSSKSSYLFIHSYIDKTGYTTKTIKLPVYLNAGNNPEILYDKKQRKCYVSYRMKSKVHRIDFEI